MIARSITLARVASHYKARARKQISGAGVESNGGGTS